MKLKCNIMIAVCPNGHVFQDNRIVIKSSTNVSFNGGKISCPVCGSLAQVLTGKFNFDEKGLATLISGPQFTIEILDLLKKITEEALKEDYSPEEFINKVKATRSPIFEFLKEFIPSNVKEFKNALGWILTILIPILYDRSKVDQPSPIINITINYSIPTQSVVKKFNQKKVQPRPKKAKKTHKAKRRN